MKEYHFRDLTVGTKEEFNVVITEEKMKQFCIMSGDINPLHCQNEYGREQGFKEKVVYGMLCASFYSTLAGVYLPGKFCVLHSVETMFKKPVYVGDTLKICGEVVDILRHLDKLKLRLELKINMGKLLTEEL